MHPKTIAQLIHVRLLGVRELQRLDRGASLVEYALLLALIAAVCIVAITYFGTSTSDSFSTTGSSIGGT